METNPNLYSPEIYRNCLGRIEKLKPNTKPKWGKMSSAQMFSHCAEVLNVANGKPLKNTPLIVKLFKGVIRKMVISEQPYPHNTKTHPQYLQTSDRNFDEEKQRLLKSLEDFVTADMEESEKSNHPLFGSMTREEKGWASYKHLDHHLVQFGV